MTGQTSIGFFCIYIAQCVTKMFVVVLTLWKVDCSTIQLYDIHLNVFGYEGLRNSSLFERN